MKRRSTMPRSRIISARSRRLAIPVSRLSDKCRRKGSSPSASFFSRHCGRRMGYTLDLNLIWRHFDKLWGGLLLSLELAVISIAIGIVIGLVLAVWYVSAGRVVRTVIAAYVEFIRNVPLILLVYLVFYGLPTVVDLAYSAPTSFVLTLSVYSGAYLVEVFRSGLEAVPRGQLDAGKAIGLTPWQRLLHVRLPTMLRITLPALSNTFISLFKDTSI